MKKSHLISLLLSVLLLTTLLGGFVFAAGANLAPVDEITVYCPGDPPAKPDEVYAELNKRVKQDLNIKKVTIIFIPWSDLASKTTVKLTAGDTGDLFFDAPWLHLDQMVAKNMYIPLDELLPKYGPGILKAIPGKMLDANKVDGKIYGLPIGFALGKICGLAYRADLGKKYGAPKVDSYASLEKYFAAIVKNDPTIIPTTSNNDSPLFDDFFEKALSRMEIGPNGCMGYVLDNKKAKVLPFYQLPNYRQNLQRLQKWYRNGWIEQDILAQKDAKALWHSGRVAVYRSDAGIAMDGQMKAFVPSAEVGEWVPIFAKGQKPLTDFKQWNFMCINRKSRNPERALMFLNWLYGSQENYDLLVHGIKGKHWIDAGKGLYKFPAGYNPATEYLFPWYVLCGNPTQIRLDAGMNGDDLRMTRLSMDPNQFTASILTGFSFDVEPVKSEVAKCVALYSTKLLPLWDGVATDIDAVTKAYQEAGYEKVIAEMQRQVNAFIARKK